MGFKEWLKQEPPLATFHGARWQLHKDRVERIDGTKTLKQPLDGVTARVEAGSDLEKRVTATRLVAMGVFAPRR